MASISTKVIILMKAKQYSFKSYSILVAFLLLSITSGLVSVNAQCPTVTNTTQSLCDVESVLVGDLQAADNGGGIVWYETSTSSVPLLNSESLISGEDYYADDNTGACGTRARVDVTIYGPPLGNNFQGVCLDDPSLATVADLDAAGNDVQWYLSPSGGLPLNDSTVLIDDTIYYADQANPDTGCRTSRLSVLVNVGFTPIPTGDAIQEFCVTPQFTPTVADLVASGSNNWYISLFSALPLPNTTPLIDGQTYYSTTLDPPCESSGRLPVLILLNNGPNPGTNGTLDLCEGDTNSPVDLFTFLGGSPQSGGTWSPELNSTTGVYDSSIDPDGVYTYTVSSNNICPDESSTVTVTLNQEPNSGINGVLDLCSNSNSIDLFNSLGGTPDIDGVWSPSLASGTGEFNPAIDVEGIYIYTVSGIAPCNDASSTVNVSLTPFKDAGEDGTIEICDNNGTIDLFDSLGGTADTGGNWSPTLNSGTGIFDPLIDAQDIYTYSFTGNAPCPDTSATVTVIVNALPDAGSSNTLELCSNDTTSIDLFDSLGGAPETGGAWSPILTSGTGIFDPTVDTPGIYTYLITGISPCPNTSAAVNVSIITEPNAGLDAIVDICSNNGTIDLFDNLGGTPDTGGTWSPALNSGTGVFDPTIDAEGTFIYTVIGTTPCPDDSATLTISLTPFIEAGENGSLTICTNDAAVDLFNSLEGTPDIGGSWSPALNSGTSIFDPSIDTGGTYTYITSAGGPCSDDSATVIVSLEIAPDAGSNGTLRICNTANSVDLFDSLDGTPQTGGIWTPTLTSGTGFFDPNTDADVIYTYTISSLCGDSSATVTVSVDESNDAGSSGSIELCTNDTAVDLFNSLSGTPDSNGIWSPVLNSGTGVFDPSLDSGGTYTYTVSNSATLCPDTSSSVIITLLQEPNAGSNGTLNLCNASNAVDLFDSLAGSPDTGGIWSPTLTSGTGVLDPNTDLEGPYTYTVSTTCGNGSATVIVSYTELNDAGTDGSIELCTNDSALDLFDILGGTPDAGGTWSPTLNSGTGIFDPSLDSGGTFTYTISTNESQCNDASANVIVTLLQEPDAGSNGTLNLCNASNSVDLFDSLAGTPDSDGTWSPTLSSGTGLLDPNTDPEGTYTYTVTSTCGNSAATVVVSYTELNDAGTDGSIELCTNDTAVDLFNILGGTPDVGGTWSPALNSGTGVFDPSMDSDGTYTYTISTNESQCNDASAIVTVTLLQEPDPGSDGTLNLCSNNVDLADLFDNLDGTPDTGGVWSPSLTSGTGVFDPNTDPEGTYTYTINSTCGNSSASVTVAISNLNDAGNDGAIELCSNDSAMDLFDSLGGTPQSGGIWSPSLNSGTGIFDPSLDSVGTFVYTVSDGSSSCPQESASVTVTLLQEPDAGNDGTLNLCNATNSIDLFDSLAGSPDSGGTWSPALTSGTGLLDPNTDPEGTYTYTVSSTCGNSSATVSVSYTELNDAGTDGSIDLCTNNSAVDLFDTLGGTPNVGGNWSPSLTSGTGVFDPSMDSEGIYTYTISSEASLCPQASAIVTVSLIVVPNAGSDGAINICSNNLDSVDLFDNLTGTADSGGTWLPALTSGTGVFDPNTDPEGTYTYTINSTCGNSSASVIVTISNLNDAGSDGSIEFCNNDSSVDLFNSLGGTPGSGGIWSPSLTSGTGVFDPSLDSDGIYTYTISSEASSCPEASANVTVTILALPNAGNDNTINLCIDDVNSLDLFDSLGGTPDTDGIWSPALNSGTGVFDPTIDTAGIYTYTVTSVECVLSDESTVTVIFNDLPDVTGLVMSVDESICLGSEAIVSVTGANQLADGDYTIVYQLTEANISLNTTAITITGGNSTFIIPQNLLQNSGSTIITISQLFIFGQTCGAGTQFIEPIKVFVIDAPVPQLIDNGEEFCLEDNATIADLTNNIIDPEIIIWYDEPEDGSAYSDSEILEDGGVYYAGIQTENGCVSRIRLEVTVSIISCIGDLLIPDGFSPNGDGINDDFDILFLDDLYPNFKLSIYNRYGNILYEGDINTPKWDGTWKNNDTDLPVGVYFYILEFNDGERDPVQGRVYLSR